MPEQTNSKPQIYLFSQPNAPQVALSCGVSYSIHGGSITKPNPINPKMQYLIAPKLLKLWSRSLPIIIKIQSNSTVAENENSCALCVGTNLAIIAKRGRWQRKVLTFFLSNLLKKSKIHPFSQPDASYSWRFHHPTQSIHPKPQCLIPQQI